MNRMSFANLGYTRQEKGIGLSQANRSYDFKYSPFFWVSPVGDKKTLRTETVAWSPSVILLHWAWLMISTWKGNNFVCASQWCVILSWRISTAFCLLWNGFGAPTVYSGSIHLPASCCWDAVCSILQADKITLFLHVQVHLMDLISTSNFLFPVSINLQ
jgi:hypothetical protein